MSLMALVAFFAGQATGRVQRSYRIKGQRLCAADVL